MKHIISINLTAMSQETTPGLTPLFLNRSVELSLLAPLFDF
jgi:hypothetical protein